MSRPAPHFKLEASSTERTIGIPDSLPKVLVLLFQDQNSVETTRQVNETIRGVYEESEDLVVASVVDMSGVPRFMRKMAQNVLHRAYEDAAQSIPADRDPADYIVLLPDWSGKVFKLFEVDDVLKKALMVIIDHEGNIVLRKQGGNLGESALEVLDKLI